MDKFEQLKSLTLDIRACKKCPLCHTRDTPTISRGDPRSPLMVIGDFPRAADHTSEESFKGRAGKKLDSLLTQAAIQPGKVYFTTLLKCHTGRAGFFPEDDSPARCFGYLLQQLRIVNPLVVVLAGPEAVAWVLARGTEEAVEPLSRWSGKMFRRREIYGDIRFFVIPHPVTLARETDDSKEVECIDIFSKIREFIKAKQTDAPVPDIELVDLKREIIHDKKAQMEAFKWKKPEIPPDKPLDEQDIQKVP